MCGEELSSWDMLDKANESFMDEHWVCHHGNDDEPGDFVDIHQKCPYCGRMDYNDSEYEKEQQRLIEIEQNLDYLDGEL